jgi:hypothetical protein
MRKTGIFRTVNEENFLTLGIQSSLYQKSVSYNYQRYRRNDFMARSVRIDPLTRIEGHLAFRVEVSTNRVVDAFCSGEMFRGFEVILKGRHPMDAQQITQRITE